MSLSECSFGTVCARPYFDPRYHCQVARNDTAGFLVNAMQEAALASALLLLLPQGPPYSTKRSASTSPTSRRQLYSLGNGRTKFRWQASLKHDPTRSYFSGDHDGMMEVRLAMSFNDRIISAGFLSCPKPFTATGKLDPTNSSCRLVSRQHHRPNRDGKLGGQMIVFFDSFQQRRRIAFHASRH
jgi:hypothetical protein